jgi:hypothetical protein
MLHGTTAIARHNTVELSDDACGDGILTVSDACGDTVESVVETDVGCCEDQGGEKFAWADGNDEAVCMSTTYHETFSVTGGAAPFEWAVTKGSDVASWGVDTTTGPANNLRTWASEPTTIRVRVQDACGEVIHRDISVGMEWDPDNPETIGQNDEVAVSVIGGVGPFRWTASGTGYSMGVSTTEDRVNLLISDDEACGSAEITVTDSCNQTVEGGLRGTEGGFDPNPRNGEYFWGDNTTEGDHTCGGTVRGIYKYHLQWKTDDPKYPCTDYVPSVLLAEDPYGLAGEGGCTYFCSGENNFSCYRSGLGVNWYPKNGTVRITRLKWEC